MCVALSRNEARRALSWVVKWARSVEAIGYIEYTYRTYMEIMVEQPCTILSSYIAVAT
jgi:hypothetical protein